MADGKRLTRRLVIDQGEINFLVRDTRQSGTLVGAPQKCPLGHILTYYDGSQPQFTHLRASMLAYAQCFYVRKSALKRLEGVEALLPMKKCNCRVCVPCLLERSTFPRSPQLNGVIRTRSSTCPLNMQPTSPSLIIKFVKQTQKRTSLSAPHRATTTHCQSTA